MQRFRMYRSNATSDLDVIDDASVQPIGITGTQNGVNVTFTLSDLPGFIFRNGLLQKNPDDYSISGNSLVWVIPPLSDDIILGFSTLS